jgi:sugar phosphate permease
VEKTAVERPEILAGGARPDRPTRFRWLVLAVFCALYLICYMDRSNIGIAQPEIASQFGLSKTSMGLILAAFTWAYALGQVPLGWLGDRIGPRKVLILVMSVTGLAAILTGSAVGISSLLGARLLLGLGEAGAFPVASRAMHSWFSKMARGRIQGITHFFSRLAVAVTPFLAMSVIRLFGWRAVFYLDGLLAASWVILFYFIFTDLPERNPRVNAAELMEIRDGALRRLPLNGYRVPWKAILSGPGIWYIALGYACFFFGTNFYLTWYPTYLREYRHLSLQSFWILGSLPLAAGMAGDLVGGAMSDFLLRRTGSPRIARRAVAALGFLGAALFVVPAAVTPNASLSILFLAASFFCLEWVVAPAWAVPMDVGGPASGTVTGIMNMAGALAASLTALIYGRLFDRGWWIAPFLVSAGVLALGAVTWTFLIDPARQLVKDKV